MTGNLAALKPGRLSKLHASKLSPRNWNPGATNCCNRRGSAFLIMFKTGQALLLRQRRFLRPRSGRGLDAEYPRHRPASRSWSCPVRDRVQDANSPCPPRDRVRNQSATLSWPCPHPRPQSGHVRDRVRTANVRVQPVSMNNPWLRLVRSRAQSMTVSSPCSWTVHEHVESGKSPGHGCIASARRTVHLQTLSAYVRL